MARSKPYLWIANLCAFIATIAVNVLANALPIGGLATGQISAMYPTLFTPPGFTFGIWGLIYALLSIFIIISVFSKAATDTERIGPYFIVTCVFNIAWIFTWHYQLIGLSFIAIIGLLISLFQIYRITRTSGFITKTAFSIYYSWITIATVISAFVLIKTLSGGAPVTPIEPRTKVSAYTLDENNEWVELENIMQDSKMIASTAGTQDDWTFINVEPTVEDMMSWKDGNDVMRDYQETAAAVQGDLMLINETEDSVVIPEDSYKDTTDQRIILVGGDPEIASYVSTAEYIAATFAVVLIGGLSVLHVYKYGDYMYALTALWAMGGIAYRQFTAPKQPVYMLIVAVITVAGLLYSMLDRFLLQKRIRY